MEEKNERTEALCERMCTVMFRLKVEALRMIADEYENALQHDAELDALIAAGVIEECLEEVMHTLEEAGDPLIKAADAGKEFDGLPSPIDTLETMDQESLRSWLRFKALALVKKKLEVSDE